MLKTMVATISSMIVKPVWLDFLTIIARRFGFFGKLFALLFITIAAISRH
jgi:hypothetical protein